MERNLIVLLLTALVGIQSAKAQTESGLLLGAEVDKKLNQKLSLNVEADFRTRNDFKTIDRWSGGVGASYKFSKWLKADAGYTLLYSNYREKVTDYVSSKGNAKIKWRPSYWGIRHRFHASLSGSYKFSNNIRVSLRERWQYTYRPEESVTRWKLDPRDMSKELDDDYLRNGKGKNQLRSRLQIAYDKKRALLTPYASAELYNSWGIEKVRYTVGTDIRLGKQQSLGVYYRYQNMKNVDEDDYDPDMHYLGIGYKLKF